MTVMKEKVMMKEKYEPSLFFILVLRWLGAVGWRALLDFARIISQELIIRTYLIIIILLLLNVSTWSICN